jgi:hypothetical protein
MKRNIGIILIIVGVALGIWAFASHENKELNVKIGDLEDQRGQEKDYPVTTLVVAGLAVVAGVCSQPAARRPRPSGRRRTQRSTYRRVPTMMFSWYVAAANAVAVDDDGLTRIERPGQDPPALHVHRSRWPVLSRMHPRQLSGGR